MNINPSQFNSNTTADTISIWRQRLTNARKSGDEIGVAEAQSKLASLQPVKAEVAQKSNRRFAAV